MSKDLKDLNFKRSDETKLLDKNYFYKTLKNEHVSNKDYKC